VKALLLLMYGLSKSKCNYQFKVIAIRLYCLLGDLKASCKLFESLDVKYIQFDTFSQILLDDAVGLRIGSFTSTLVNAMEKFYTDARKELSDLIALPYRYNSYSRV
jgi:N-terminal acetyltransferase B complex non-catalytic subunit